MNNLGNRMTIVWRATGGGDAANRLLACVDSTLCVVMPAVTTGVVEQAAESADTCIACQTLIEQFRT